MEKFNSGSKKIQNLMSLYSQLDNLPNRGQWHFEPHYVANNMDYGTCAFVFGHTTTDMDKRYDDLNRVSNVLYYAGIKCSLIAVDGIICNIIIDKKYAELARKLFARYQIKNQNISRTIDPRLEQEWLRQRQK